ncbi:MAG: DUF6785 family protein [Armatimonadota bacterium]
MKNITKGITLRAILTGVILIPILSYWIFLSEIIRYQGHPTTISIFYSSIFVLTLMIGINALLSKYLPKFAYSQAELITVYVMMNIGSAIVAHDFIQVLISIIPYPMDTGADDPWLNLFKTTVPQWLVMSDSYAIKRFFLGGNLYDPLVYKPWLLPIASWTAFILVLCTMFLSLNVLLRKQWMEREKLSYPLIQLPMDMTAEGYPLFKNKLFWIGFGIVAVIDIINGLHILNPDIPGIAIKNPDMGRLFTTRPWNAIGLLPMSYYPFGIGLGVLLPVDLSFSCWFFFWVWKMQRVATAAFGWETVRGMPFINEQSFGAYMGICLFVLYMARKNTKELILHFLGRKTLDDSDEPIRYKTAIWILIFGCIFITLFCRAAGMSGVLIIAFFVIYFALSITITRMRAELGPPAHDLHNGGPDSIIPAILGNHHFSTRELGIMGMFFWFNRAYRAHSMPIQLESFKMAEKTNTSYKWMYSAILIATVVGTIAAFWAALHLIYQTGASKDMGPPNVPAIYRYETWSRIESWTTLSIPANINFGIAIMVGFVFTLILNAFRMRLGWFPFHPVGYAVSSSWAMHQLWMPMLIAWAIKIIILRYGGLKLYRKALPFFLGIILGECMVGGFWTVWGILTDQPSYAFWP